MKIQLKRKWGREGGALVTTVIICTVLGITMAGYLLLIGFQSRLSSRSQAWNLAIAYVESGIEEALQQLNSNTADLTADGWQQEAANVYSVTRTLGSGGYVATIYTSNSVLPVIIARATVQVSRLFALRTPSAFFAAEGVSGETAVVTRSVRVYCSRGNLYIKAIAARDRVDLNGQNIVVDSYDSGNPLRSDNGRYPINNLWKRGDRGDVAVNGSVENSALIDVGNADIWGHVSVGPEGEIQVNHGSVGSLAWHQDGNTGIQPNWSDYTANFTFPDTRLPADYASYAAVPGGGSVVSSNIVGTTTTALPSPLPGNIVTNTFRQQSKTYPAAGTYLGNVTTNIVTTGKQADRGTWYVYDGISGYTYGVVAYYTNNYDHIISSPGNYQAGSLSGKVLVAAPGVVLVLPNGLSITSGDSFTLSPGQNADITIYAGGASCAVSGQGVINELGLPEKFIVKCDPSVTSLSFNGNAAFVGVLVAPNASVQMNGGGNDYWDFIGALMAKSVKLNGHFSFHYDEALGRLGADSRYLVSQWDEL